LPSYLAAREPPHRHHYHQHARKPEAYELGDQHVQIEDRAHRYPESVSTRVVAFTVIALACGGGLPAQTQRTPTDAVQRSADKTFIQATGEGTISAKPDQAVVEIGVVSQGATAAAAAAQNAKQTDAFLAELGRVLGAGKKLRTTNYSVHPNYQYPKPGATPTITGYTATNVVEVTLDDLSLVGKVIDTATQSGANIVQRTQFQLKNSAAVRAQALRQAAEQARISADAIAAGLGVKVVRVLSAEEITPEAGVPRLARAMAAEAPMGAAPPTPLEVGMIEVTVRVLLRVEIAQ
jgi:uncharacterized protein YggE